MWTKIIQMLITTILKPLLYDTAKALFSYLKEKKENSKRKKETKKKVKKNEEATKKDDVRDSFSNMP